MWKYFGFGPALRVRTGTTNREAVGRGDLAAAPGLSQGDLGLVVDQPGVGLGDGLGPDVILLDPGQPASGQRRDIRADQGLQADVARLGQEYRAEAQVEVADPCVTLADVAEFAGEVGPGQDL